MQAKPIVTIAIDPGKSGGVAVRYPDKSTLIHGLPKTETEAVALLREINIQSKVNECTTEIVIEKVGGFVGRGQPGSSMFVFGRGVGILMGAAIAFCIPIREITPQAWMKGLGVGSKNGRTDAIWKRHLVDQAKKRHPGLANINANTADALLLLDFATQ